MTVESALGPLIAALSGVSSTSSVVSKRVHLNENYLPSQLIPHPRGRGSCLCPGDRSAKLLYTPWSSTPGTFDRTHPAGGCAGMKGLAVETTIDDATTPAAGLSKLGLIPLI